MNDEKNLPEGVTQEHVEQLVRKHGPVYPVRVTKAGQVYIGLFRKPKLSDMSAAATFGQSAPVEAGELLYRNCKLAADPAMDTDDEVHLSAINAVAKLFRVIEAEVGEPFGAGA